MLRFFDSAYISRAVALFVLAILFFMPSFLLHYSVLQPDYFSPLFSLYLTLFGSTEFIHSFVSFLLTVVTALSVNWVATEFGFSKRTSYRAAFIYILFSAALPDFIRMSPMVFINFILVFYTLLLMRLPSVKNPVVLAFNGGLLIGITALFYMPAMWLLVVQLIAMRINRITKVKAYLSSFMGFFLPFLYLFVYYYLTDDLTGKLTLISSRMFAFRWLFLLPKDTIPDTLIGTFLVMVAIGLFRAYSNLYRRKISKRRNMMTLMYMVLVLFFVVVFCSDTYRPVMLLLVPGTIVISNYLRYIKREKLAEAVFLVLFVLVLFNQYFQLYYAA